MTWLIDVFIFYESVTDVANVATAKKKKKINTAGESYTNKKYRL